MRKAIFLLFITVFCYVADVAIHPQGRPIPPGVREADKQSNAPLEPPALPKRRVANPAQLKSEASELAELSAAIPAEIEKVNLGQIPKDLSDHLKRIEKLAKHLRSEIMR
ncbi:MAG: hypothetical protein DME36_05300 [Verrucomicrobia bacterium]|nr:MAG: hypothetical protein DME36_05300 [Verrucomicrobiota bacterium]